jgi:DNA polymerase-3 subunit epsilon
VANCPCAGTADKTEYAAAVDLATRAFLNDPEPVADRLRDKMTQLAAQQRFEEAATTRDRLSALYEATYRREMVDALRHAGRAEITLGDTTWIIERAQLIDAFRRGIAGPALPVAAPVPPIDGKVLSRSHIDEALCLARFYNKRANQLTIKCTGTWLFPISPPSITPPPFPPSSIPTSSVPPAG